MLCHVHDLEHRLQKYDDICAYDGENDDVSTAHHHGGGSGTISAMDARS